MRAVKITSAGKSRNVVRSAIDTGCQDSFVYQMSAGALPAVHVVRNGNLDTIRQFDGAVIDRGVKHKSKPLGEILLGYEAVPLVEGSHTKPGQFLRSSDSLMDRATEKHERNSYVIGVRADVFEALWEQASEAPQVPLDGEDAAAGFIASQLRTEVVPEGLIRLYQGESKRISLIRKMIMRAGMHESPVLIMGDNGAGKRLAGNAIHQYGTRAKEQRVEFNCTTVAPDRVVEELFGAEASPDSDPNETKIGAWEAAGDGTIMLYGIGELSLDHQRLVLRAIKHGEIRRKDATSYIKVGARVIAATSRDLRALVDAKRFRDDLFFLLRRFVLEIPPLHEHPQDIAMLARSKWKIYAGKGATLSDEVIRELQSYGWPGNVTELKSFLSNLYSLYGNPHPTVTEVRSLMLFRQQSEHGGVHWIHCVKHMQRVRDNLAACEFGLREWMDGQTDDVAKAGTGKRADLPSIQGLLQELGEIGEEPLLFNSWPTYRAVHELHGRLKFLYATLLIDRKASRKFWKDSVADRFDMVIDVVEEELVRIVGND